ncbi:MAG TPA: glutathione S-transferase [Ramlibacter sp.]|nr:glutathione S-transferase [Ramlibacter sp.]
MYRLHCFSQSGNSFKVAFFLRALHQPWEAVFVDFMNGMTRDASWREQTNEMGEAPVLEDGPRRLTQSGAILAYLARKHGAFAGRNEDEQQEVLRWLLFDNHKFTSYFATYRFMKSFGPKPPDPTVMAWLKGRIDAAFAIAERHLAARPFIVGDAPTIADFSMSAYLLYPPEESGYQIAQSHPNIAAWLARMRAIDGFAAPYDVLPGERILPKW